MKTKTGREVSNAFKDIIKQAGVSPENLHVDKGKEFVNKDFKQLMKQYKINMYHTENEEKSPIIERFNRTLNDKLRVHFEVTKNFKWIDILPTILNEYNYEDIHSKIKMPPAKVNQKNEKQILESVYVETVTAENPALKIGDRVRITSKKNIFQNKYHRNWTTEIFVISKIQFTTPITYRIKDLQGEEIEGSFYKQELQSTAF